MYQSGIKILTPGDGLNSEELVVHLTELDPNKSGSWDRFDFLRWYVEEEVFMDSAEEAESLVGWGYKVRLMDLHGVIFWRFIKWRGNKRSKDCLWRKAQVFSLRGKEKVQQHSFSRPGREWGAIGEKCFSDWGPSYWAITGDSWEIRSTVRN